jgi:lipopolysaccharide export system permease protein
MLFKKLDKLVIRAFLGPFAATFFITLLVLVMQFFWLYIDDFVGKGLGPGIIAEFILYQSAVLVPLALPLSVLLSSLMTFGNLGESSNWLPSNQPVSPCCDSCDLYSGSPY